jgi:endonuclease/exonuclease/phosphatase family metal-dependent hydrolase
MTHTLTLATYNIHHGEGVDRRISIARIAGVLKDTECDVACLQELDCRVPRSRRGNQPRELARALGMQAVYAPTINWPLGARYGNLILTRLPLLAAYTHMLPGGKEKRGLAEAHVQSTDGPIAVFCTHWGLTQDERLLQAAATAEIIARTKLPVLLAGDLNEDSAGPAQELLVAAGLVPLRPNEPTYPSEDPTENIDHVYGSAGWRSMDGYTIPSLASDHRPLVVELTLSR